MNTTPSQDLVAKVILDHFLSTFGGKNYGIKTFQRKQGAKDTLWLTISTGGNVYVSEGACIRIGKRGGYKVITHNFNTHKGLLETYLKEKIGRAKDKARIEKHLKKSFLQTS